MQGFLRRKVIKILHATIVFLQEVRALPKGELDAYEAALSTPLPASPPKAIPNYSLYLLLYSSFDVMFSFITNLFSTESERNLKNLNPYLKKIHAFSEVLTKLTHDQLRQEVQRLRKQFQAECQPIQDQIDQLREKANASEDIKEKTSLFAQVDGVQETYNKKQEKVLLELLPEVFAIVKETAKRFKEHPELVVRATPYDIELAKTHPNITIKAGLAHWANTWEVAGQQLRWDMVHYDVQLIGGIVLHQGKIAEMGTGEGKTLVATLPAFLNALAGRGVHIVTVNNYLARRDTQWMGPIYQFHGFTVDCIEDYSPHSPQRKKAYQADIVYGTSNEFGFDYLRDNMATSKEEQVQRGYYYAIVDEIDSILIDDARTPLIISGPARKDYSKDYRVLKPRIKQLYEAQKNIVAAAFKDAQEKLNKETADKATKEAGGISLFRVYRGLPKYQPLISYLSQKGIKQILAQTEDIYIRENAARMPEIDEPLLFTIDQKLNAVELTDKGIEYLTQKDEDPTFFILPDIATKVADIENNPQLSDPEKIDEKKKSLQEYNTKSIRIHTVSQLLKAFTLFEKDVDYVVLNRQVKIVDEKTGRILEGRRYSDGLHQAIEAKEDVSVQGASQTYASITPQNQFRMYTKLSGMTGTAATEAAEMWDIYQLEVVVVPPNKPVIRKDLDDRIYKTQEEKFKAIVQEVYAMQAAGRPVLLITPSVEVSEQMRKRLNLPPHQVLNAKNHRLEAQIIAEAGVAGKITIATQMAGRGTDIKLTPEARKAGGLVVMIVEKNETRRVDNQARGRAGRQGDPGTTICYLSLEDNLIVHFRHGYMGSQVDKMFHQEGAVLEDKLITRAIETVQKNVEQNHFAARKRALEYDNVLGQQRNVIYQRRNHALSGDRLALDILHMTYSTIQDIVERGHSQQNQKTFELELMDILGPSHTLSGRYPLAQAPKELIKKLYSLSIRHQEERAAELLEQLRKAVEQIGDQQNILLPVLAGDVPHKVMLHLPEFNTSQGKSAIKAIQSALVLGVIDEHWKEQLQTMDELKESVSNAAYEQKDPLLVYKYEAVALFKQLMSSINKTTVQYLHHVQANPDKIYLPPSGAKRQPMPELYESKPATEEGFQQGPTPMRSTKLIGRNERVTVQYIDGTIKKNVKYKTVEHDLEEGKCVVYEQ